MIYRKIKSQRKCNKNELYDEFKKNVLLLPFYQQILIFWSSTVRWFNNEDRSWKQKFLTIPYSWAWGGGGGGEGGGTKEVVTEIAPFIGENKRS